MRIGSLSPRVTGANSPAADDAEIEYSLLCNLGEAMGAAPNNRILH